jgi:hypothetical protein
VAYATLNVTDDSRPDLVVFKDMCDATVGDTHWDVYPWGASGFAATPSSFVVPAPRCQVSFDAASQNTKISYATTSVTGDGRADLVVYKDACDATVGNTHWDVYPWTVSGFEATPIPFAVPAPRCQVSFDKASQDAQLSYATMSVTQDDRPDLVVFKDGCDATVGTTHWDLYGWSASGFAATPVSFTVPASRCQVNFNEAAQDAMIAYATWT